MQALYRTFASMDASMLEINPFLLTRDGALLAPSCCGCARAPIA